MSFRQVFSTHSLRTACARHGLLQKTSVQLSANRSTCEKTCRGITGPWTFLQTAALKSTWNQPENLTFNILTNGLHFDRIFSKLSSVASSELILQLVAFTCCKCSSRRTMLGIPHVLKSLLFLASEKVRCNSAPECPQKTRLLCNGREKTLPKLVHFFRRPSAT